MKLVTFRNGDVESYGVATEDGVFDAGIELGDRYPDLKSVLAKDALETLEKAAGQQAATVPYDEIEIRPVKKKLSERILCRHFGATRCSDLVALDSLSAEHTARWMAIELARRDEDDPATPGVLQRMASYPSQHHRHNQMSMCPNPSRKL